MLQRTRKKILYGAFYISIPLAIASIVFYVNVILPNQQARVPTPTPNPFQPIQVEEVNVISYGSAPQFQERTVDLVARLRNPNPTAGIAEYAMTFVLYDTEGKVITETSDTTYLLPGAIQYLPVFNVTIPAGRSLGRIQAIQPTKVDFQNVPVTFDLPQFNSFLTERTEREGAQGIIQTQLGNVTNTGTLDWERVEVVAVALNTSGDVIAVGKTFVGRLLVREQREFSIDWPKPEQPIGQVIAVPSTNIFLEDNFVETIGNPQTLR